MKYPIKIALLSFLVLGLALALSKPVSAYPIPTDCSYVVQDQASCEALGITQWIEGSPVYGDVSSYHVCEVITSNELDPFPYELTVETGIRLKGNGLFYLEPGLDPLCIPAPPVNGLTLNFSAADGINIDMTTISGYRGVFVKCSSLKDITVDGGWLGFEFFGGGDAHNIQSRDARYSGVQLLRFASVAATGISVVNPGKFGVTQFPQSVATIMDYGSTGSETGYLQKKNSFATLDEYSATGGMMGLTSQGSFVAVQGEIANNSLWGAHAYDEGVIDLNDLVFEQGDLYASDGAEIRFSPGEVQLGADAISQASLASVEVPVEGSSNLFDFFREGGGLLDSIFKGLLATIGVDGQIVSPQLVSEITVAPIVDADIAALAAEGVLTAEPEGTYSSVINIASEDAVQQSITIQKATEAELTTITLEPSILSMLQDERELAVVAMVRSTAELAETMDASIKKLADPSRDVEMDALISNPGNTKVVMKQPLEEPTEKEKRAAKKSEAMLAKSAMKVEHSKKKIEMEPKSASPLAIESIFSKLDESGAVLSSVTVTVKEIENAIWSNKKLSAAVEPLFEKSEDMDSGILQPKNAIEMELIVTKGDITDSTLLDMSKEADLIRLDVDEFVAPFTYPYGGRIGCALVGGGGKEACSEEAAIRVFDRDCSQGLLPWEAIAVCEDQGNEYDEGLDGDRRIFTILSKLSVVDLVIEDEGKYAKHPINMENKDSWIMNVHQYGPPPEDTDLE